MSERMLKILLTVFALFTVLAVFLLLGLTVSGSSSMKDPTAAPSSGISATKTLNTDLLSRER